MKKLLLMIMLCIVAQIHAEERKFASEYFLSYPKTIEKAVTDPLKWQPADWLVAGGIVGIGTGLYMYDTHINHWVRDNRTDFTEDLTTVGNQFGDGKYILPAIGLTIGGGYLAGSDKTMDTGLLCLKSFMLSGGVITVMKFATQRDRPFRDKGKGFWNSSGMKFNRDSFPSGHTTVVWSIAPVLAAQYKGQVWVAPLVYSIAGLTSYSRLHSNKHWASDVFAGGVIGFVTAKLTLQNTPNLIVVPGVDGKSIEVSWNF